jgi:hypothetical protein
MQTAAPFEDRDLAARAGRLGSRSRWGECRRINLRDLDDAGRRIVLASLAAVRAEKARDAALAASAAAEAAAGPEQR